MSFILDALKKLDHKRQHGSVPDLMTVHEPVPQELKRRPLWLYLFLGALLVNSCIMMLWLHPWQSNKIASLQGEAGKETSSTTAVKKAADLPARLAVKRADWQGSTLSVESIPAEQTGLPTEQAGSAATKRAGIEVNEAEIRQNLKKEAEEQDKILNTQETASLSHPSVLPAGQAGLKQQSVTEGTQNKEIPYLDELPLSVRQELPTLTIVAHIYSNNSASRMANINGRTVREGQNVADGIKLEEITLNGVILRYRDYRFRIRM